MIYPLKINNKLAEKGNLSPRYKHRPPVLRLKNILQAYPFTYIRGGSGSRLGARGSFVAAFPQYNSLIGPLKANLIRVGRELGVYTIQKYLCTQPKDKTKYWNSSWGPVQPLLAGAFAFYSDAELAFRLSKEMPSEVFLVLGNLPITHGALSLFAAAETGMLHFPEPNSPVFGGNGVTGRFVASLHDRRMVFGVVPKIIYSKESVPEEDQEYTRNLLNIKIATQKSGSTTVSSTNWTEGTTTATIANENIVYTQVVEMPGVRDGTVITIDHEGRVRMERR